MWEVQGRIFTQWLILFTYLHHDSSYLHIYTMTRLIYIFTPWLILFTYLHHDSSYLHIYTMTRLIYIFTPWLILFTYLHLDSSYLLIYTLTHYLTKGHVSYCYHWAFVVRLSLAFCILTNSSKTTGPIWTKLWWNGPWVGGPLSELCPTISPPPPKKNLTTLNNKVW